MAWGGPNTAQVIAPPPLLFLGAAALGVAADQPLGLRPLGARGGRVALGAALFATGAGLGLWTVHLFKRAGTNVVPDKPTTALVTSGPFRRSRNPGYICQALMYLGVVAAFGSTIGLVLFGPLIALLNARVIAREEAYLERLFGDDYRRYRAAVPRWL